jgi:hypothetical protein
MRRAAKGQLLACALTLYCFVAHCLGQGTMTYTFEGQASGTERILGGYTESGMQFGTMTPQSLYLSGGASPATPTTGPVILRFQQGA